MATIQFHSLGSNQNGVITTIKPLPLSPPAYICAWIAGFFDAEGTFVIKGKFNAPIVAVYNNDVTLLEFVQKNIGGRLSKTVRKVRSAAHAESYQLEFTNHELVATICSWLEPFLVLKKRQAQTLLAAVKVSLRERDSFKQQIKELNAKQNKLEPLRLVGGHKTGLASVELRDWFYLAGMVDGDGWIFFQTQYYGETRYFYPWLGVTGTKLAALIHLYSVFGGELSSREEKANWATKLELVFKEQKCVEALLEKLVSCLVGIKRRKAELCLEALKCPASMRLEFAERMKVLA